MTPTSTPNKPRSTKRAASKQSKPAQPKSATTPAEPEPTPPSEPTVDVEKQREAELKAGKHAAGGKDFSDLSVPEQRAGGQFNPRGPVGGRVDNMTRRSDAEPLQGHFVVIDYSDNDVVKTVKNQLAPKDSPLATQGFEPGVGSADYGVYLHPGQLDRDGYPETAVVLLRDEHAAQIVVPYGCLKPAPQGGRR